MGQPNMGQTVMDSSANVQAAFGNASQVLQAQPMYQQPVQNVQQMAQNVQQTVQDAQQDVQQSVQEAQQNVQQTASAEPTLIQGSQEEPDINVEMVDL